MNNSLKALALCAGIVILTVPAYAQTAAQPLAVPHTAGISAAAAALPAPGAPVLAGAGGDQEQAPSYDDLKAAFLKLSQSMQTALTGPQVAQADSQLQSDVADLAKIEQQFVSATNDPKSTQAQRDQLVDQYAAKVQEIESISVTFAKTEQQIVSAVNEGLEALHGVDDQKASADADVKKAVEGLQALVNAKLDAPANAAQAAVKQVLFETQRSVQAQMPALIKKDLTQAVQNLLETKAAQ